MGRISLSFWKPSRTSKLPSNPIPTNEGSSSSAIVELPSLLTLKNLPPKSSPTPIPTVQIKNEDRKGLIHLNKDVPLPDTYSEGTFPIDIIAIHGINGGAYSSWTHSNGLFWLGDLLTEEFPGARIYSFAYAAKVFLSLDTSDFEAFARGLLEGVLAERETAELQRRPIIFICHSMGGIILKKALNISVVDSARYSNLRLSIPAILFLATPHSGSDPAVMFAAVGDIVNLSLKGTSRFTGRVRSDLLKSLKKGSKELQSISRDFRHHTRDLHVYSFIEQSLTKGLKRRVVDDVSGSMNVDTEVVIPMADCDHRSICRFESKDSESYRKVLRVLQDVANKAINRVHAEILAEDLPCLQSISFPSMRDRLMQTSTRHPITCTWLLNHPKFRRFTASRTSLLWIKGHPGTGKSTLMAFLHSKFQTIPEYAQGICLDFFFSANGEGLQKTSLGMFRCLLHQLYRQSVNARRVILNAFQEKEQGFGRNGEKWEWSVDELALLFEDAVASQPPKGRDITILVDALDEALDEGGTRAGPELLGYFHRLTHRIAKIGGRTRICVSCRHYPVVSATMGLEICVEDENAKDLAIFVRDELWIGVDSWDQYPVKERDAFEEALARKASGVFLWAHLRLPKIVKALNDGSSSLRNLQALLESESNELFAMYESILVNDIEPSLSDQALLFLQWVCLAERPLSLAEIRFAMASDECVVFDGQRKCEESKGFVESDARMQKLTKSLSGGLVKVLDGASEGTVQPFHATVNEYLRAHGFKLLSSVTSRHEASKAMEQDLIGISEDRLSKSCLNYLKLGDLLEMAVRDVQIVATNFQFTKYAMKYWLLHAERAERHGINQEGVVDVLECQPKLFRLWKILYYEIDKKDSKCPDRFRSDPINVASTWNLQTMVRRLLASDPNLVHEADNGGSTPLHHAAQHGYEDLALLLLENDAKIDAKDADQNTPLDLAVRNGHEQLVRLLLQKGVEINKDKGFSNNALRLAARNGNLALVKVLLQHGADANVHGGSEGSPLYQACHQGHLEVVRLLLAHHINVNGEGGFLGTALHAAVLTDRERSPRIVQLLLDAGADPNVRGCDRGNAFQAAAKFNLIDLVKLLLKYGADINAFEGEYGTALHAACAREHDEVIDFLLENGANVNLKGGEYGTALQAAAYNGSTKYVRILLQRGVDVNVRCGFYGTAIQAGFASQCPEVVDILLNAGARIDEKGGHYGNNLQAAVSGRNYTLAKKLLNEGFNVNEQGGRYGSALQAAFPDAKDEFVKFLVDSGADVNAQGGWYGSPLEAAVHYGREAMVALFIAHGADINAITLPEGTFPLQSASCSPRVNIVRLLLDAGAEVNLVGGGWRGTALQEAIMSREKANVALLLDRGARMGIPAGIYKNGWEAAAGDLSMTKFLADRFGYAEALEEILQRRDSRVTKQTAKSHDRVTEVELPLGEAN